MSGAAPEEDEDAFEDTGKLSKNIHVPRQVHKQSLEEDAPEAQALSSCKRDEHSARTTLDTSQHTKISRYRVHNSIFKRGSSNLR
jgi:hypothetical protein